MLGVKTTNQFHAAGKKTNPIKLLGIRQHIKLGSRQQAGNSVFFNFKQNQKLEHTKTEIMLIYLLLLEI
jgi:hypothetical protein